MNARPAAPGRVAFGAVLLALAASGCASSGGVKYSSPEQAHARGQAELARKRYDRAIEFFQGVFTFGRTNEWADEAQLGLAQAYFADGQYILAANAYTSFAELYRTDPRAAEAAFQRAVAYERQAPGFQLDQTPTERAIEYYGLFLGRYPDHARRAEAEGRISVLRDKLARKLYEAAELYNRRDLYEAAAVTYERTFNEYPDAAWADDALVGAARSYLRFAEESVRTRRGERLQKGLDATTRLVQLFPTSPLRADADALAARLRARLGEPTAQR